MSDELDTLSITALEERIDELRKRLDAGPDWKREAQLMYELGSVVRARALRERREGAGR